MNFKHFCSLESENLHYSKRPKWYVRMVGLREISEKNPRTKIFFRSLSSIEKERTRHRELKHSYIIHPFSMFRVYWDSAYVIIFLITLILTPYLIMTVEINQRYDVMELPIQIFDVILMGLSFLDIIMTFFTGFCIVVKKEVVLSPKGIGRLYVRSADFYLDILCSIPFTLIGAICTYFFSEEEVPSVWPFAVVDFIKIFRLKKFLAYFNNITGYIRHYNYQRTTLKYSILIILSLHWLTCIYIVVEIGTTESERYYKFRASHRSVAEFSYLTGYFYALYITTSYLLGISLVNGFRKSVYFDLTQYYQIVIFIIYAIFGFVFCNFLLVLILQMIMSLNSSEIKYHAIISQLTKYMIHKDLPRSMRERILSYYEYRFQKKYFRETTILNMLSETLRRDINLHLCRTLIESVSLLKDLPPDVISEVVSNLKYEVFLYNDVIVKAGSPGDCMYFISNGTVAVSTPTGKEICHLQDGAYFGEIALISREQKRVANVVAIEICEIYRLDRKNFKNCFPTNSVHYKKIEQIAQERMEKTILLEELHKKYILEKTTKRKADEATKAHYIEK